MASTFALQSLHSAAAASGNGYWRPTLPIGCSLLGAGQTDVMTDQSINQFLGGLSSGTTERFAGDSQLMSSK